MPTSFLILFKIIIINCYMIFGFNYLWYIFFFYCVLEFKIFFVSVKPIFFDYDFIVFINKLKNCFDWVKVDDFIPFFCWCFCNVCRLGFEFAFVFLFLLLFLAILFPPFLFIISYISLLSTPNQKIFSFSGINTVIKTADPP